MTIFALCLRGRPIGATVRPMALVLAVLAAAGLLSGCLEDARLSDETALMLDDPERRHAITFDRHTESLYIEAPSKAGGRLEHEQIPQIHRYMRRYRDESTGRMTVSLPRSAGGHHATRTALHQVKDIMHVNGIDPASIIVRRYHASRDSWPTIRLSYQRPVAQGPLCGDWSEDVGQNRERIHYPNYGCATQRNLAAGVDNARDLLGPRDVTPRSSERRSTTWKKYVGGKGAPAGGNKPSQSPSTTARQ